MEIKNKDSSQMEKRPEAANCDLQSQSFLSSIDQDNILDMESVKLLQSLNSPKDPEFFSRLVDAFITFGQKNIAQMNEALHGDDLKAISRYAHALKGSCSNFGANGAVRLCTEIEKKAAAEDWGAVPNLAARISSEFAAITQILYTLRNQTELRQS